VRIRFEWYRPTARSARRGFPHPADFTGLIIGIIVGAIVDAMNPHYAIYLAVQLFLG
jgi:hypothetical protein